MPGRRIASGSSRRNRLRENTAKGVFVAHFIAHFIEKGRISTKCAFKCATKDFGMRGSKSAEQRQRNSQQDSEHCRQLLPAMLLAKQQ
jgi:hypothetical protein